LVDRGEAMKQFTGAAKIPLEMYDA
jgi:hypothetical protein